MSNEEYKTLFDYLLKGARSVEVTDNVAILDRPIALNVFNKFIVDKMSQLEFMPYYIDTAEDAVDGFGFREKN